MPMIYPGPWKTLAVDDPASVRLCAQVGALVMLNAQLRSHYERTQIRLSGGASLLLLAAKSSKNPEKLRNSVRSAMKSNFSAGILERFESLSGLVRVADERVNTLTTGLWAVTADENRSPVLVNPVFLRYQFVQEFDRGRGHDKNAEPVSHGNVHVEQSQQLRYLAHSYSLRELGEIQRMLMHLIGDLAAFNREIDEAEKFVRTLKKSLLPQYKRKSGTGRAK